jgi:hypothetical protein
MGIFTKKIQQTLAKLALVSYLGFGIFGFLHLLHMEDMPEVTHGCPFSHLEQTLCFTETNHVLSWFSILSTFTEVATFILFLSAPFFTRRIAILKQPTLLLYAKRRREIYQTSILTLLFSQGIIHTKRF